MYHSLKSLALLSFISTINKRLRKKLKQDMNTSQNLCQILSFSTDSFKCKIHRYKTWNGKFRKR